MPTIIGPQSAPNPSRALTPIVDVKKDWSDAWIPVPELRLRQMVSATSSQALSTCQVVYPYGRLKHPWQSAIGAYSAWDLTGWWLRVRFFGRQGAQTAWLGKVMTEDRELHGASATASGVQTWVAWGPETILQKISVSESYWLDDSYDAGRAKRIGWVPPMNLRDERGSLVGNRSATKIDDVYLYGGTDTWTHKDYVEYLLHHFVSEDGTTGPTWTLGGQADILDEFKTAIDMSMLGGMMMGGPAAAQTVDELLHALIPRKFGVDYTIFFTPTGFEIFVFALSALDVSFGGKTLPKNPRTVRVVASRSASNPVTRVVKTAEHQYEKIRVLGARAVACFSLWGPDAQAPNVWQEDTLEAKWTAAQETAYKAGAGAGANLTAEDHDRARQDDRLRPVYQFLGAPDDWVPSVQGLSPKFNDDGQFDPAMVDDYQTKIRSTVDWLPLREGFDYTFDPPLDNNPPGYQPELLPTAVWVSQSILNALGAEPLYDAADQVGIGVSVPDHEWGVQLAAGPNHRMAQTDFLAAAKPTKAQPEFDWPMTVATIAIRTDQRLALTVEIPGGGSPSGGVMEVEAEDAEFWLLLKDTVVGIDADGHLKRSPNVHVVLRDDRERILQVMAGAMARYLSARARAEIEMVGLHAWGALVGQVLTVVEQAGSAQVIHAPITAVEWTVPDGEKPRPMTTIRTGFAE